MIYTLTASPSLDLVLTIPKKLESGVSQRAVQEEWRPGGRGINISIMLRNLGIDSTALGFVAGFSGDELMRLSSEFGVRTGFIRVRRGRTRINIKLRDPDADTRINGLGPVVSKADIDYLNHRISGFHDGDFLILAGNIPPSLPQDIYGKFCATVSGRDIKIILDAPCELWDAVLPHNPFLFKAKLGELAEYSGCNPQDPDSILAAGMDIKRKGALNVLISLGPKGALFLGADDSEMHIKAPAVAEVVDKSGAGDSMIAGFMSDYLTYGDTKSAVKMAVAAGSATAGSAGFASATEVRELRELM
jgi:1-phosphofructokinase